MKLYCKLFVALFFLIVLSSSASAVPTTMRCGTRIVQTGDSMFKVLRKCGEPSTKAVVGEKRVWDAERHRNSHKGSSITVTVERWTYDLGGRRFPRVLTFYGDRLVKIELEDTY